VVEDRRERILLAGDLPSPARPPSGCRFHTRCPWRQAERCDTERPVLREITPGHRVACHWAEDIRDGKIRAHEVTPELVEADWDAPLDDAGLAGPASITETLGP
jgi:peptide/nickel transport system ATP-binding protein